MGCLGSKPAQPSLPVSKPPQLPPNKDNQNLKLYPVQNQPVDPQHPLTPKKTSQLNPYQIKDPTHQNQPQPDPYKALHPQDNKPHSEIKYPNINPPSDIKPPQNIPASDIKPNSSLNHQNLGEIRQSDIKLREQLLSSPNPKQTVSAVVAQKISSNISEGLHHQRQVQRNLGQQLQKIEQQDLVHSEKATNFTPPVRNINFHIQMT